MSEIKTGGPAFPLTRDAVNWENRTFEMQGMTLRDYFAAKMMTKYMVDYPRKTAAILSYDDADAMIIAREAKL